MKSFHCSKFILKDDKQNYYEGDNGFFENNLNYGEINNIKIKRISPGGVMVSTEVCGTLSLSSTLSPGTKK